MYRSTFVIACIVGLLTLTACSRKTDTISFDGFFLEVPGMIQQHIHKDIIQYTIWNSSYNSWDLLTIYSGSIDPSASSNLGIWVANQFDILQIRYPQMVIQESVSHTYVCPGSNIDGYIIQYIFDQSPDKHPLYLGQYFFIYNDVSYILSYSTPNSWRLRHMVRYRQQMYCP